MREEIFGASTWFSPFPLSSCCDCNVCIVDCRNIEVMKQRLKDLWKEGTRLCLIPGSTGELAKVGTIRV